MDSTFSHILGPLHPALLRMEDGESIPMYLRRFAEACWTYHDCYYPICDYMLVPEWQADTVLRTLPSCEPWLSIKLSYTDIIVDGCVNIGRYSYGGYRFMDLY